MAQVNVPTELPAHADCHKQPERYIGPPQRATQVMLRPMTVSKLFSRFTDISLTLSIRAAYQ